MCIEVRILKHNLTLLNVYELIPFKMLDKYFLFRASIKLLFIFVPYNSNNFFFVPVSSKKRTSIMTVVIKEPQKFLLFFYEMLFRVHASTDISMNSLQLL